MTGCGYWMNGWWKRDDAAPEALAQRFLDTLNALSTLNGDLKTWVIGDDFNQKIIPLAKAKPMMADIVRGNVVRDDDDEPEPQSGYWMNAVNRPPPDSGAKGVTLRALGGSNYENLISLELSWLNIPTHPALATYSLVKSAMLVLTAHWPCDSARAGATDLNAERDRPAPPPGVAYIVTGPPIYTWIAYVSKSLSEGVGPVPGMHSERTPDGGLLLSATLETFDPSDPEQVSAARRLEKIWNSLREPAKEA